MDEISGGVRATGKVNVQVRRRYIFFGETCAIVPAGTEARAVEKIAASEALKKLNVSV